MTRRRRNEREEVRIINQEWVENNCTNVTVRDREMLRLLIRFPLLNSEHLYYLTPGVDGYKPFYELSQGQKRCNDRIRALYDMHCVNKESPRVPIGEGTSKQYVWIDRAGIKLLGLDRRARHDLPFDYKHTSLVMDTYCFLVAQQQQGTLELRYHETEQKQSTSDIIPDIVSVFKYRELAQGKALFIEVDRSQKKEADEKDKLERYRGWQLSESWRQEPWCAHQPRPFFPTIVYLFDEHVPRWRQRMIRLEKHAKKIGLQADFLPLSEFHEYIYPY